VPAQLAALSRRDGAVDLLVLAFAVVLEHDFSALIDDVLRRPILVAVGVPGKTHRNV